MVRAQQREWLATSDHPGDHPVVGSRQQRLQHGADGPARANRRDSRSAAPRPHDAAGPEIVAPHGGHWNFGAVTAEPPGDPQERDAELRAHAALRRPGEPMVGGEWRPYFEQRFAADFSDVRVHADAPAAGLSRALGANAFTVGRDVHFAADRFAPGTPAGRALLAHELGHVLQQRGAGPARVQRDATPEPTTVAEIDEAIARIEAETQKQAPGTATSDALFKRRSALLAKRAALLGKTSTPPPAKAAPPPPDWRDAIAAFNAQHPPGDFPTFGKPAAKPAATTDTVGMIVESHVPMATSARKTHWASASDLVAFMDAYIAYAAAHPALKLEHDQAVAARESVLADYLAAHGATPFPFDPGKLAAAGQLLPKPKAPAKPPSKSTGMIVESHVSLATSVRKTHFASEDAMVAFMDEYIAYAKEHSTTQKEYQEAVAAKDGLIAEYHANIVANQLAQIEAELGKQHEADTVKMLKAPLTQGQQLTLAAAGTAELLGTAMLDIVDELVKYIPLVGEAVMAIEAISGRKWLGLGAEISDDERIADGVFAIIGLLPIVGQVMRLGAKTAAAVVARTAVRVGEEAPRLLRRLALIHALQTEEPALRRLAAMLKLHKPLQEAEIGVLRRVETKLGGGGGTGTWMTAGSAAQKAAPKTGLLGLPIAEGVTVKLPAVAAKEAEQVAAKKVLDAGVASAGGTTKIFDMGVGERGLLVEGLANDVYKTMGGNVQRTPKGYDFIDHYYGGTTSNNGGVTVVEGPTVISDKSLDLRSPGAATQSGMRSAIRKHWNALYKMPDNFVKMGLEIRNPKMKILNVWIGPGVPSEIQRLAMTEAADAALYNHIVINYIPMP